MFRLKHRNGTYYRRFIRGFGPEFGATLEQAATFSDRIDAVREMGLHWAMGDCDVEESAVPAPGGKL